MSLHVDDTRYQDPKSYVSIVDVEMALWMIRIILSIEQNKTIMINDR